MKFKKALWKTYFAIYLLIVTLNTICFFWKQDQQFWYYQVLMAFDIWFIFPYCFNALSIILNALAVVPLYFLVTDRDVLSKRFWRYFFILRLTMEFFGKSYEVKVFQSLFYESRKTAWIYLGILLILTVPSYIGTYIYAFRKKTNRLES